MELARAQFSPLTPALLTDFVGVLDITKARNSTVGYLADDIGSQQHTSPPGLQPSPCIAALIQDAYLHLRSER
jgi:hypothetical protein